MKKIASFTVDHDTLDKGMYISRIDGDIVTYDVRMKKPNGGDYLDMPAAHTIEHLFATFSRNTPLADNVIYIGPMGCRTGFYFLVRGTDVSPEQAIELTKQAFDFIASYDDEIPGVSAKECGNYRDHSLEGAKAEAARMVEVMKGVTVETLVYPE